MRPAAGLERPSQWQSVAEGLRARGHSEDVVRGVMHDNAERVFEQVIDRSGSLTR